MIKKCGNIHVVKIRKEIEGKYTVLFGIHYLFFMAAILKLARLNLDCFLKIGNGSCNVSF